MIQGWSEPLFMCTECDKEVTADWLRIVQGEKIPRNISLDRSVGTVGGEFSILYDPINTGKGIFIISCGRHPGSRMTLTEEEFKALSVVKTLVMRKPEVVDVTG